MGMVDGLSPLRELAPRCHQGVLHPAVLNLLLPPASSDKLQMSLEEDNFVLKYELRYSVDALSDLSPKLLPRSSLIIPPHTPSWDCPRKGHGIHQWIYGEK